MLLDWQKTKELLEKYQIPIVQSLIIENLGQGIDFTKKTGWPVVLKLLSQNDLHKIDKGLVKIGIQNERELEAAFQELEAFGIGGAEFLLQKQISGTELFVGMKRDKSFGPVISFGLGGIFVEVLKDIVFGICPIEEQKAQEMIKSIKGYKILEGFRGQKGVDISKLTDILIAVSHLAMENEEINEIDINPLFAQGSEVMVADVKAII